jgi:hypothetical protein
LTGPGLEDALKASLQHQLAEITQQDTAKQQLMETLEEQAFDDSSPTASNLSTPLFQTHPTTLHKCLSCHLLIPPPDLRSHLLSSCQSLQLPCYLCSTHPSPHTSSAFAQNPPPSTQKRTLLETLHHLKTECRAIAHVTVLEPRVLLLGSERGWMMV